MLNVLGQCVFDLASRVLKLLLKGVFGNEAIGDDFYGNALTGAAVLCLSDVRVLAIGAEGVLAELTGKALLAQDVYEALSAGSFTVEVDDELFVLIHSDFQREHPFFISEIRLCELVSIWRKRVSVTYVWLGVEALIEIF